MNASDFGRLFEYDRWANSATLASLEVMSVAPARAGAVMAHIVAAEWLWWARLRGSAPRFAVWPSLTREQCRTELDDLAAAWGVHLGGLPPDGLRAEITYTNTRGERWAGVVGDVLLHVVMHSTYHRGQIAAAVRQAGGEPAYTDFIHGVRTRLVPPFSG